MGIADLAWAAGFIDGEGCVAIHTRGARRTGRTSVYFLRLMAFNLDPTPLYKLQAMFGGRVRYRKRVKHLRPCGQWVVEDVKSVTVLEAIRPYLVVKAAQADVAIEFAASKRITGRAGLTSTDLARYEGYKQQISALKRLEYVVD